MLDPKCALESVAYRFLRDFETQSNHLISARQPDLVICKKKKKGKKENLPNSGLCHTGGP